MTRQVFMPGCVPRPTSHTQLGYTSVSLLGLPDAHKKRDEQEAEQEGEAQHQQQKVEHIGGLLWGSLLRIQSSKLGYLLSQVFECVLHLLKLTQRQFNVIQ